MAKRELVVRFDVSALDEDQLTFLIDEIRGHVISTMLETEPQFEIPTSDAFKRAIAVFQTRRQSHAFNGQRFDRAAMLDSIAREFQLSDTERGLLSVHGDES